MILNVSTCMAGDLNDSKREQNYFLIFYTTFWILLHPVLLPPPPPSCKPGFDRTLATRSNIWALVMYIYFFSFLPVVISYPLCWLKRWMQLQIYDIVQLYFQPEENWHSLEWNRIELFQKISRPLPRKAFQSPPLPTNI